MLTKTEPLSTIGLMLPNCVVFTPDKNRTWAESFGLSALLGHSRGRDTAEVVVRACFDAGIRDVVFWAMSESNIYKRPTDERLHLVKLLKEKLKEQESRADADEGFYLCGRWKKHIIDAELDGLVERAHKRNDETGYQKRRLTVLFGYRGIRDLLQACAEAQKGMGHEVIENEDLIRRYMWIRHLPPHIDMLVRTGVSDENRHNSDSLLPLHGENAYVYDVPVYWPDFTVESLYTGLRNFSSLMRSKGS